MSNMLRLLKASEGSEPCIEDSDLAVLYRFLISKKINVVIVGCPDTLEYELPIVIIPPATLEDITNEIDRIETLGEDVKLRMT